MLLVFLLSNCSYNKGLNSTTVQKDDTYFIQSALDYLSDTSVVLGGGLCPKFGNLRFNKDLLALGNTFINSDNFTFKQSYDPNFQFSNLAVDCQIEVIDRISYKNGKVIYDPEKRNKNRLLVFTKPMKYDDETYLFLVILYGYDSSEMVFKFNKADKLIFFDEYFPNK